MLQCWREILVNIRRICVTMFIFDKPAAFLTMLCRVLGVTPDTIKAVKDKNNRLRLTAKEAVARVKGLIAS